MRRSKCPVQVQVQIQCTVAPYLVKRFKLVCCSACFLDVGFCRINTSWLEIFKWQAVIIIMHQIMLNALQYIYYD